MSGSRVFIAVAALVFLLRSALPMAAWADEPAGVCGIYTQADAAQLFQVAVSPGISKPAMLPAGESCRYRFNQNGDVYGIQVRITDNAALQEEGVYDSVQDLMARQKQARQSNAYAAKRYREIPGLGDEAFWSGDDLWVRKGERLVMITVNAFLAGSFKDMEEAGTAKEEQNLSLAQQAAQVILPRLN